MPPLIDLTGKRFGRLLVLKRGMNAGEVVRWICLCDCGNRALVRAESLPNGHTQSCGCWQPEATRDAVTTHGKSRTKEYRKEYRAWIAAKSRCRGGVEEDFKNYTQRGIKMCKRWNESFQQFFSDMGPCPSRSFHWTLERMDNDRGYEPGNCIWADRYQQNNNSRRNVKFQFKGELLTISQLSRKTGITIRILQYRLRKKHMSVEEAVTSVSGRQAWRNGRRRK